MDPAGLPSLWSAGDWAALPVFCPCSPPFGQSSGRHDLPLEWPAPYEPHAVLPQPRPFWALPGPEISQDQANPISSRPLQLHCSGTVQLGGCFPGQLPVLWATVPPRCPRLQGSQRLPTPRPAGRPKPPPARGGSASALLPAAPSWVLPTAGQVPGVTPHVPIQIRPSAATWGFKGQFPVLPV